MLQFLLLVTCLGCSNTTFAAPGDSLAVPAPQLGVFGNFGNPISWITPENEVRFSYYNSQADQIETLDSAGKIVQTIVLKPGYFKAKFYPAKRMGIVYYHNQVQVFNLITGESWDLQFPSVARKWTYEHYELISVAGTEYVQIYYPRVLEFHGEKAKVQTVALFDFRKNEFLSQVNVPLQDRSLERAAYFQENGAVYGTLVIDNGPLVTVNFSTGEMNMRYGLGCHVSELARQTVVIEGKNFLAMPTQGGCVHNGDTSEIGIALIDPMTLKIAKHIPLRPWQCIGACHEDLQVYETPAGQRMFVNAGNSSVILNPVSGEIVHRTNLEMHEFFVMDGRPVGTRTIYQGREKNEYHETIYDLTTGEALAVYKRPAEDYTSSINLTLMNNLLFKSYWNWAKKSILWLQLL